MAAFALLSTIKMSKIIMARKLIISYGTLRREDFFLCFLSLGFHYKGDTHSGFTQAAPHAPPWVLKVHFLSRPTGNLKGVSGSGVMVPLGAVRWMHAACWAHLSRKR